MSRSSSSSYSRSRSRSRSPRGYRDDEESRDTIFAGNLNHETNEEELKRFFSTYGRVVETTIIYDQHSGRPKGFGFVKFEDQRDAEDAVADANGKILGGRPLKCNMARSSGRGFNPRGFRGGYRPPPRFGDRAGPASYSRRRRSRSASPGRYLPDRYSPERSSSPRKRPRYSPNTSEQGNGLRSAPESARPRSTRRGSPSGSSTYTSGSSYTTSDTEAKAARPRDPPTIKVGPEAGSLTANKELQEAKQRESETSIRVAALEAEIEQGRVTKQEMQVLLEDTAQRLQRSELTCKQFRKWLHALMGYSQAVMTGRDAVKSAQDECGQREQELGLFLKECHEFLGSQKKPKRKHGDRQLREAKREEVPKVEQEADYKAEPDRLEATELDGGTAAKFKPGIKFKLAA